MPDESSDLSLYRPEPSRWHDVLPTPSAAALARYNARVLNPATAVRISGEARIYPTIYIADHLIVAGQLSHTSLPILAEAAAQQGVRLSVDEGVRPMRSRELARAADFELELPQRVRLVSDVSTPAAVDAWAVLQSYRSMLPDAELRAHVSLDHLMCAHPMVGGHPDTGTGQTGTGRQYYGGVDEYVWPGSGGRAPVAWLGHPPHRTADFEGRRPVVAVLDTGAGEHRWLPDEIVQRGLEVNGVPVGYTDPATAPERSGVLSDPYEGLLDSDSGHGTFISGLIRQRCPDADIIAIRVMDSDGVVPESVLLDALGSLAVRQLQAQAAGDEPFIDVVSLSLGYYHEQPDDAGLDPKVYEPLHALGRTGAVIVASAGNDATDRPALPAAFTPYPDGYVTAFDADCLPVLSVGALNPNGTVALFSNAGQWVRVYRPGAAIVSTFPVTFNGAWGPSAQVVADGRLRQTIDPDDFLGGFGTWSGTSFSAPMLAGELAQQLLTEGDLSAVDRATAVARGWRALTAHLRIRP